MSPWILAIMSSAAAVVVAAPLLHRYAFFSERKITLIMAAGIAILASAGFHLVTGRFEPSPAQAPDAEAMRAPKAIEQLAELTRGQDFATGLGTPSQPALATVDEMIERLARRLQQNPNDAEGWRMLGWSYFATDQFADAAAAYANAIEQNPAAAGLRTARGEALVSMANGLVTAEAKRSFEAALQLDPKDSRARFFAGLAKEQSGDKVAALDDWIAILNEVDPNDPSISDVMAKASELGRSIGVDVAKRVQRPQVSATADVSKPPLEPQHPQPAGAAAEELSLSSD